MHTQYEFVRLKKNNVVTCKPITEIHIRIVKQTLLNYDFIVIQ